MNERMTQRVLVATDLSDQSPALIAAAAGIARTLGAEMTILHVFDPQAYEKIFGETGMPVDQYTQYLRASLVDQVKAAEVDTTARLEIVEGRSIALAIVSSAVRMRADLIVIGMRRRRRLRALGGGVADEVLRRARTAVLIIPPAAVDVIEPVAVAS